MFQISHACPLRLQLIDELADRLIPLGGHDFAGALKHVFLFREHSVRFLRTTHFLYLTGELLGELPQSAFLVRQRAFALLPKADLLLGERGICLLKALNLILQMPDFRFTSRDGDLEAAELPGVPREFFCSTASLLLEILDRRRVLGSLSIPVLHDLLEVCNRKVVSLMKTANHVVPSPEFLLQLFFLSSNGRCEGIPSGFRQHGDEPLTGRRSTAGEDNPLRARQQALDPESHVFETESSRALYSLQRRLWSAKYAGDRIWVVQHTSKRTHIQTEAVARLFDERLAFSLLAGPLELVQEDINTAVTEPPP
jgi:hypothetical protein